VPYIEVRNPSAQIEHEATTSKISDDQLFYAMQRGLGQEEAVALIVNGFAKEVLQQLPMEFAVEAQKLLGISLDEGSHGNIGNSGTVGIRSASATGRLNVGTGA
jgi:Fe-S cluster assembly protein SufB